MAGLDGLKRLFLLWFYDFPCSVFTKKEVSLWLRAEYLMSICSGLDKIWKPENVSQFQ